MFFTLQAFLAFFSNFFSSPPVQPFFPRALSLESGCKDKANVPPFPNILTIIFHLFFKGWHKNLAVKPLGTTLFSPGPREKAPPPPGTTPSRGPKRRPGGKKHRALSLYKTIPSTRQFSFRQQKLCFPCPKECLGLGYLKNQTLTHPQFITYVPRRSCYVHATKMIRLYLSPTWDKG